MRLAWIAALALLAGCKDRPREAPPAHNAGPSPGPASGAPAAAQAGAEAAAPDVCRISVAAVERATCAAPEGQQKLVEAKKALGGVVDTIGKTGGGDARQLQVMCAQMLLAIQDDAAKLGCKVELDPGRRKEIDALIDAWYGQRTPVVPTGDAAADAVIAKIAVVRDAACACRDAACLDRVDGQLPAVGAMPAQAPEAARTLAGKLLEDAARCATRVRTLGPR